MIISHILPFYCITQQDSEAKAKDTAGILQGQMQVSPCIVCVSVRVNIVMEPDLIYFRD